MWFVFKVVSLHSAPNALCAATLRLGGWVYLQGAVAMQPSNAALVCPVTVVCILCNWIC